MTAGRSEFRDALTRALLPLRFRGRRFTLLAPHSVFSSSRIDDGTKLLLDHLPPGEPGSFLDLGCGYGAIGIPVAAAFPRSRGLLADRDLLAVEFARRNAEREGISSVEVAPSLGYRDLPGNWGPFDWILLNAPARAGERALEALIAGGRARLRPGGEMRVVVIAPIAPALRAIASRESLPAAETAAGAGHAVFSFPPAPAAADTAVGDEVYERDVIDLQLPERLVLVRPTDLADEPLRLPAAIPLLAGRLPQSAPVRALAFRCGYGLVPALLLARYPEARVDAVDRDLLATTFAWRNCRAAGERIRILESLGLKAIRARGPYDLIAGELSPPLGQRATVAEIAEARAALAPGGTALILGLHKQWGEFLERSSEALGLRVLERRGPVGLFEVRVAGPGVL